MLSNFLAFIQIFVWYTLLCDLVVEKMNLNTYSFSSLWTFRQIPTPSPHFGLSDKLNKRLVLNQQWVYKHILISFLRRSVIIFISLSTCAFLGNLHFPTCLFYAHQTESLVLCAVEFNWIKYGPPTLSRFKIGWYWMSSNVVWIDKSMLMGHHHHVWKAFVKYGSVLAIHLW